MNGIRWALVTPLPPSIETAVILMDTCYLGDMSLSWYPFEVHYSFSVACLLGRLSRTERSFASQAIEEEFFVIVKL